MSGVTWHESGGAGPRTILLLHGLGATGAVWHGLRAELERRALGRWIAPDLSGHGHAAWEPRYSVGQFAANLADLVRGAPELYVIGHSLGVYVGLALASRWFGVEVRALLGVGPKIAWPPDDVQSARELAARPVRWHVTDEEAWGRYRRVSGLNETVAPGLQSLQRGIVNGEQGWRLAQDPRTFEVAGAPFSSLASSVQCRILLARGASDAMVAAQELRHYAPDALDISNTSHNAHVEAPAALAQLFGQLVQHV